MISTAGYQMGRELTSLDMMIIDDRRGLNLVFVKKKWSALPGKQNNNDDWTEFSNFYTCDNTNEVQMLNHGWIIGENFQILLPSRVVVK